MRRGAWCRAFDGIVVTPVHLGGIRMYESIVKRWFEDVFAKGDEMAVDEILLVGTISSRG